MYQKNIIEYLYDRNLIAQVTNEQSLIQQINTNPITLYCGFDPTADSLHLGHLVLLLCLKRFQEFGHRPIVVIGSATGLIGDPSFKKTERKLHEKNTIQEWTQKIVHQISLFLDFNCGHNSAIIIDNDSWLNSMNILTFLRDIGKFFSVKKMICKEMVKNRLDNSDKNISFTEFSYSLLQGYDFAYLYKKYGVILQIGGSDQWGNIVSGIHLTKRMYKNTVYGLTLPLITKSNGMKFGKTENETIWLDANKTSPYKLYQFLINVSDHDVYNFLKFLTLIDINEIRDLEKEFNTLNIRKSYAQNILAKNVTYIVHGKLGLEAAQRITSSLFYGQISDLKEIDFIQLSKDGIPKIQIKKNIYNLQRVLVLTHLATSFQRAKIMIKDGAITVNGQKIIESEYIFCNEDFLYNKYTIICRGKKNHFLIHWNI